MTVKLREHQRTALGKLRTGSILCGGVGSGKTLTSIAYFYTKELGGVLNDDWISDIYRSKDLIVITTAKKRDTLDWERECSYFAISKDREASIGGVQLIVDSWNNISKYTKVENAFFIFDEQRVVGYGAWVKSFLKIAKKNNWILLSATPGDVWMDYAPVFIANGFYKNKTEFIEEHVVWNSFTKYPKVSRYVGEKKLMRLRDQITVNMDYEKTTVPHHIDFKVEYDKELYKIVAVKRWNPFDNRPIKDITQYCVLRRKVVNGHPSRLEAIEGLLIQHHKLIIFYNFDFELEILRKLSSQVTVAEYNGHRHDPIPTGDRWVYLVQYLSGAEGWNCIDTNVIVFYSMNYSFRIMTQAAGRIDRMNTPFHNLYYYTLKSDAPIDVGIAEGLVEKKNFNEKRFIEYEE